MLKLASIVERETAVESEKVKVAGVYTNRLDGLAGPRFLNAEPTVIYANDGTKLRKQPITKWPKYRFWGLTGVADLSKVKVAPDLVGYQSWLTEGLPPTPIDSPTMSSIQAAANPDTRPATSTSTPAPAHRRHLFAKTLAGQRKNINSCASRWRPGPRRWPTPRPRARVTSARWLAADAPPARRAWTGCVDRMAAEGVDAYFGVRRRTPAT